VDGDVPTPLVSRLVRAYVRSGWRGSTRCTFLLARHLRALQAVPITVHGHHHVFVDLRDGLSHELLAGSPWSTIPWEVDEQRVMRRLVREGDVVFDVGAHIGLHTVLLSEFAGARGVVHAFEANPSKVAALRLTAGQVHNVVVHAIGLSDREAREALFVPEDESMASLRNWTEGRVGAVRQTACELRPIDALIAEGVVAPPDFIKCDVEGGERHVFAGAARTLDRESAPIILYEANLRSAVAFGAAISAATDLLRALRAPAYSIFHVLDGRLRPLGRFTADCDHYNLVAVPRARASCVEKAFSSPSGC
jgi:FkbM family methyltransferase